MNKEYVLLIGGYNDHFPKPMALGDVFKFNGTWFPFGKLNMPRYNHNSIYWNGNVYVFGGQYHSDDTTTIMEIWKIKDSPLEFKTTSNLPVLFGWYRPYLFIVPDSFFPDR